MHFTPVKMHFISSQVLYAFFMYYYHEDLINERCIDHANHRNKEKFELAVLSGGNTWPGGYVAFE